MYKSSEAEQKKEILDWIEAVIGEKINKSDAFEKVLKDGVILCKYVSCLQSRNDSLFCGVNRFYRCKQMYNVGLHYIPDHVCWRLAKSHFVFQFVQFPALGGVSKGCRVPPQNIVPQKTCKSQKNGLI